MCIRDRTKAYIEAAEDGKLLLTARDPFTVQLAKTADNRNESRHKIQADGSGGEYTAEIYARAGKKYVACGLLFAK